MSKTAAHSVQGDNPHSTLLPHEGVHRKKKTMQTSADLSETEHSLRPLGFPEVFACVLDHGAHDALGVAPTLSVTITPLRAEGPTA